MPIYQIMPPSSELLGTLTTNSGTTQTLSGLELSKFKQLLIVAKNVSFGLASALRLDGQAMTGAATGAARSGISVLDLNSGVFSAGVGSGGSANDAIGGVTTYSNLTTSLVFTSSSNAFTGGSIDVYGVR